MPTAACTPSAARPVNRLFVLAGLGHRAEWWPDGEQTAAAAGFSTAGVAAPVWQRAAVAAGAYWAAGTSPPGWPV